jgi:hypothetical protein
MLFVDFFWVDVSGERLAMSGKNIGTIRLLGGVERLRPAAICRRVRGWLPSVLLVLVAVACGDGGTPVQAPSVATPLRRAALPADIVLCIDNSRSIAAHEQVLLRETAMLLADLADSGDRLAVLTFDRDARVVTAVRVRGDADRRAFKKAVAEQVDFRGNHSDIRRCVHLLASRQDELFGARGESVRVPIVLSDGKLEPEDRKVREAFNEMRADIAGPLAQTGLYALVLGDTTSRDEVLRLDGRVVNGADLMREHVAGVAGRYFHATRFDQVLPIAVGLLNRAKGISSLGEEGAREFRVDDTVERLSFIVRKRSLAGGARTVDSSDIEIVAPRTVSEAPITFASHQQVLGDAVYWSQYQNFDLIVVRRPQPGNWLIRLASGQPVEVLSKVVSPVGLRVEHRPFYYLNEAAALSATLQDRTSGEPVEGDFQVRARVAAGSPLKDSQVFASFQRDAASQQYVLTVPAAVLGALGQKPAAGKVEIEVVAQRYGKQAPGEVDPWFVRRSAPFVVEVREPFVDFLTHDRALMRPPMRSLSLGFGADLNSGRPGAPAFETPPSLSLELERRADEGQKYEPLRREQLVSVSEQGIVRYRIEQPFVDDGSYRYRYRLAGSVPDGAFAIESPWYELQVRFAWHYLVGAAVLLLVVVELVSRATARLRGQITVRADGRQRAVTVRPSRTIDSAQLVAQNRELDLAGARFRLEARRLLYLRKRIRLTLLAGEGVLDGVPLVVGRPVAFPPRDKDLSILRANAAAIAVRVGLRVA